jgi:hypothetical protein
LLSLFLLFKKLKNFIFNKKEISHCYIQKHSLLTTYHKINLYVKALLVYFLIEKRNKKIVLSKQTYKAFPIIIQLRSNFELEN